MATDTLIGALSGALLVVPVAGYGAGVVRLGRRGDRWPRTRTAAFAAGLVALAVAFLPPVDPTTATSGSTSASTC